MDLADGYGKVVSSNLVLGGVDLMDAEYKGSKASSVGSVLGGPSLVADDVRPGGVVVGQNTSSSPLLWFYFEDPHLGKCSSLSSLLPSTHLVENLAHSIFVRLSLWT